MCAVRFGSYSTRSTTPCDAVLVALEVDDAVLLPRTAALVARGDAAERLLRPPVFFCEVVSGSYGPPFQQVRLVDLDDETRAGRRRLHLDERHRFAVPLRFFMAFAS
jgi:hypothetical protein